MRQVFQICEFGTIRQQTGTDQNTFKEIYLDRLTFESMITFVLENQGQNTEGEKAFTLYRKNRHDCIKVRNYVGVIELKNGTSIEILPKIFQSETPENIKETKAVFLRMLRTMQDTPFASLPDASLKTQDNFPILEIFISHFLKELEKVVQKGIRQDYKTEQGNTPFLKGKLLLSEHLKYNSSKKHQFYTEYSDYSKDNPQNRIIKNTLQILRVISRNFHNNSEIIKYSAYFQDIPTSQNIVKDLHQATQNNRLFKHYDLLLSWCELFLSKKSFTNFSGSSVNTAMLFPMERVFESYIAKLFKRYANNYSIQSQSKGCFLIERHLFKGNEKTSDLFGLKPDLILENQNPEIIDRFVIDTKWKILNSSYTNSKQPYNISQADIYQLFAYGKKYVHHEENDKKKPIISYPKLIMIYPKNINFEEKLPTFEYDEDLKLEVIPFDILSANLQEQINNILCNI
jgi:5-methylcytosine-specific restriction enzyme subunit McrC